MDFSNSISRKHPAESTNFTTPVKRRRTTVVHTPVPQNARSSMFNNSQNFSFTSSSSAEGGVPSTAPRLPMNVPITPGQPRTVAPDMGAPNTVGGNRTKLLEPRSFAPRPLQSPFAARSMRNRKSTEPGSRFLTQLRKQQAEAAARPTAKADPALPVAMSPSENPPSSKGLADSINGSRVATSSATAVQTPTPARRIHKPNFRSERKPSPRPSGSSSMYHFGGNTNTLHLPFFGTSAQSPTASSPSAPESRLASFVSKSSSGETAVRADGIINFLASSIEKAKQALAGNRADRNEERKEKEKEAIRKKIEEEQRIKRDEIFKAEIQHEKNEREEREREEREQQIRETEDKGKNMERDWFVDGAPSFVTEDTILDPVDYTLNEFHEATFVEEASIQNQNPSIITSSPIVGFKDLVEQSTSEAQNINHGGREVSSEESEEEEEVEEEEEIQERLVVKDRPKSKPTEVICIDSSSEDEGEDGEIMQEAEEEEGEEEDEEDDEDEDDDEDEEEEEDEDEDETVNMNPAPKFLFNHSRKLPGSEDPEGEEGEAIEEDEYEEYDEEETAGYDDEEDEGEEIAPNSAYKSRQFLEDDEAEEIIEQFGDEPADSGDDEEEEKEPSYIEEETERDETDHEGDGHETSVVEGDANHSLDSTVVVDGSSQHPPTLTKKIAPVTKLPSEGQGGVVLEAIASSPAQDSDPTLVSPHQEQDAYQFSPSRSITPTPTSLAGIVIIDDDASDGELQHDAKDVEQQPDSLQLVSDKEDPSVAENPGIYINEDADVFNRYDKHIGKCDNSGHFFANTDDKAIGFISAEGVFHGFQEDLEQGTRTLTNTELNGKPRNDDPDYVDEEENEEEGNNEIEADFKKALEGENGDAEAGDDTVLGKQGALPNVVEPEPRSVASDEPLIEEEENIGVDFNPEHENNPVSASREVVFTPAKEVEDSFFHHGKEQPSTPKSSYRMMSNDELSRSLRTNKDGGLVVKESTPEPQSDEDETSIGQISENKAELDEKIEDPLVDPALLEIAQAPATTSEKEEEPSPASPIAEVELTIEIEVEITRTEARPGNEDDEEEADTTMQTCAEGEDEADTTMQTCIEEVSVHSESIVIVERGGDEADESEDEGEGEYSPTLLPDSFHDRSSMVRDFREGTVEEQIIEWQQGDKRESYHKYSIREEDEDSGSEMEEEGAVEEEAPVGESAGGEQPEEEVKTDVDDPEEGDEIMNPYPKTLNQQMFGSMPPTAPSSFDTKLATAPPFGFKPPSIATSETVGERLATAPLYSFTPPTSSPSETSSAERLPAVPLFGLDTSAISTQRPGDQLPITPLFGFQPPSSAPSESSEERLATTPLFAFRPPTDTNAVVPAEPSVEKVEYPTLANKPSFGFNPSTTSSSAGGEKLASAPPFGFKPPTTCSIPTGGDKLPAAPLFGFKPPSFTPSESSEERLATTPLSAFRPPIAMNVEVSTESAVEKIENPTLASKPLFGFNPPTAYSSAGGEKLATAPPFGFKPPTTSLAPAVGEKLATVPLYGFKPPSAAPSETVPVGVLPATPLFGFTPPSSMPAPTVDDVTATGTGADVETILDEERIEKEEDATVDLGLGDEEEHSAEEAQEQEPTKVTGDYEMGENTSASERETTATPPPSEAINKKRKRTGKTSDIITPEEHQDVEMVDELAHSPISKPKKGRAVRASKRTAAKKRKGDANFVPQDESEHEEDMEVKEPEVKKRRTTRKKTSAGRTKKEDKEPYLEDEKLEDELKTIEIAVATALDPDIPPKETVELPDGSEVPAIQPEEVDISLGKELRDGKVVESSSQPKRTRKRAREASVEPIKQVAKTTRSEAKKAVSVRETSLEPEVAEPEVEEEKEDRMVEKMVEMVEEELEPLPKTKKAAAPVAPRRGRSASVEPFLSFEERPIRATRARKTPSVKGPSAEPEEQPPIRVSRAKRTPSIKGNSVEPEATGDMDIITLRNRKVVVNRQGSVDLSADETDRSTNTIRRSSRHKKASVASAVPTDAPSPPPKENVPVTPKAKRARKPPAMSAIKEAEVEASTKKVRRSKRKET